MEINKNLAIDRLRQDMDAVFGAQMTMRAIDQVLQCNSQMALKSAYRNNEFLNIHLDEQDGEQYISVLEVVDFIAAQYALAMAQNNTK